MIEQRKIYIAKCDGKCARKVDWDIVHDVFFMKQDLIGALKEDGWKRQGKKWFCPDCQGEK